MADTSQTPWSTNPNAPKIPHLQYLAEKENFIGNLAGSIFYGFVIVLFFQCMGALLNPINRKRQGIKWGLVAHTTAMFLFVTINTAISLDIQNVSYVDKRGYPGSEGLPPGPFGYQLIIYSKPISVVPTLMFFLNNWLADGLLLYRCHIIYSMNYWVIAFPSLMYIASIVMSIMLVYETSRPESNIQDHIAIFDFGVPSYSISLALNVILTLMIVIRLILHSRKIRKALGTPATTSGLYNALVTMLVESSALYAASFLLFIGPWGAGNPSSNIFSPILAETQVIAPFLIILRVANRTALTSEGIASGNVSSFHFRSMSSESETLSGGSPVSVDTRGDASGEFGDGTATTVNEVPS